MINVTIFAEQKDAQMHSTENIAQAVAVTA
jgi:hypothetical protein